jgi:hypothetical protein
MTKTPKKKTSPKKQPAERAAIAARRAKAYNDQGAGLRSRVFS